MLLSTTVHHQDSEICSFPQGVLPCLGKSSPGPKRWKGDGLVSLVAVWLCGGLTFNGFVLPHFARSVKQATWSPGARGHSSFRPAWSCPHRRSARGLLHEPLEFSKTLLPCHSSPVTGARRGALVFTSEPPTPTPRARGQGKQAGAATPD